LYDLRLDCAHSEQVGPIETRAKHIQSAYLLQILSQFPQLPVYERRRILKLKQTPTQSRNCDSQLIKLRLKRPPRIVYNGWRECGSNICFFIPSPYKKWKADHCAGHSGGISSEARHYNFLLRALAGVVSFCCFC